MLRSLALVSALLLVACDTVATQRPPPRDVAEPPGPTGLFPADAALLPDADITRIMDTRWQPPAHARIALLPIRYESIFASRYYYYGAQDLVSGQQTAFRAVEELRKLPFVYDVAYLPEFLMPANRSISLVREVAARYQADLVLLYASKVTAHPKYRLFTSDEVHGLCTVDCAVLDTRSGLILFTGRSMEEIDVKQERSSEEMPLLLLRAEQEAIDAAMFSNARALSAFLEHVDKR